MNKNSNALAVVVNDVITRNQPTKGFVANQPLEEVPPISYVNLGKEMRRAERTGEENSNSSAVLQRNDPVDATPRRNPKTPSIIPPPPEVVYTPKAQPKVNPMNFSDEDVAYLMTNNPAVIADNVVPQSQDVSEKIVPVKETPREPVRRQDIRLPVIIDLPRAISKWTNMLREHVYDIDLFNEVRASLTQKNIYHETFLNKLQNCMYHTTMDFCNVVKDADGNVTLPEISEETSFLPTLYFFDRIFHNKSVSFEKTAVKLMSKYRRVFKDHDGIQLEWLELLKIRMKEKMPIDPYGIEQIAEKIAELACMKIEPVKPTPKVEVLQSPLMKEDDDEYIDDDDDDEDDETPDLDIEMEVAEDDEGINTLTIYQSDNIAIPIYHTIDDMHYDQQLPSLSGDDRNGIWDHLIHFKPRIMFTTDDPEKYLAGNFDAKVPHIKCVIMDIIEEGGEEIRPGVELKKYIMGIYNVGRKYGADSLEFIDVHHINHLVLENIADTNISHLKKSLLMEELFMKESDILDHVDNFESESVEDTDQDEVEDDEDEVSDDDAEEIDLTQAAMDTVDNEEEPEPEESVVEEEDEVEDEDTPEAEEYDPEVDEEVDTTVVNISPEVPDDDDVEDDDEVGDDGDDFVFNAEKYRKKKRPTRNEDDEE